MKYYIFLSFFLSNLTTFFLSFTMDDRQKNKHHKSILLQQQKNRVSRIDSMLKENEEKNSICCGLIKLSLSEKDHFDLLKTVDSFYTKGISIQDIERLKKINNSFAETITYFSDIAAENFDNVTINTLNIVTDYTQQQPRPQLNKLSPTIKNYVMRTAYNKIRRIHYTYFSGHTGPIGEIAINTKALLAASASKDKTFRLWSLATGKELYIFPEKAIHGYVKFSDDGTLLATATINKKKPGEVIIKIWDTYSKENIWIIKQHKPFDAVAFFQEDTKCIFAIFEKSHSILYTLERFKEPIYLAEHTQPLIIIKDTERQQYPIKKIGYSWNIVKRSPRLYLCEQAIKNTAHIPTSQKIESLGIFKNMITSEQNIIVETIKEKASNTYIPII